ncbi:unnamed protein product [Microthlaspi erraticum]|uniref:Arabidopsis retrotransposon Orf1 C-terminal domain-containing protein n=1 Tax=Microthlaspi erraticum TaxID=1685480 RepID=A0A6D2I4D2_9BRAS|nr:unnamed protein product [Microthlaspi erraticum]CAA7024166.1 unnamed protein product [Microthlaspi erraticum]
MRYPHPETIRALGIEEDVEDIFYYTELGEFMKMALPAYREPAIQFLASLKLTKHPQEAAAELKRDGIGFITFTLLGQEYRFSMCVPGTELVSLWGVISLRPYQISKNKSSHIKNPAIRYAHKAIDHTLFARHECANVTKQELELLDTGIIQKLETLDNGEEMQGDLKHTSKAVVMINSFKQIMRNAELSYEQGKIKEAHLDIGSLITPILLATKVKLPQSSHPPTFMDIAYLNKTWFVRGMHNGKHIYCFEHLTFGISKVLLPNVELTSNKSREGILFLPTADQLFMDGGDATVNEEQGQEEGEPSERRASEFGKFDFTPYNASGSTPAITKAHELIGMLQRWCKKQDEMIKKLTETVNALKDKLSCTSPKATKTAEPAMRRSKRKRKTGASPPPTFSTDPIDLHDVPTPPSPSP